MIRLLLCDDQQLVRSGFRMILESEPDFVIAGEAGDGEEAVRVARREHPDIVLMDVQMPRMDGLEATAALTALDRPPKVLILTTFERDDYVFTALRAGASGFLLKNAPSDQLVDAVRQVAAGDALLAPSVTRRLIADYARRPRPRRASPSAVDHLTPRETEILTLVAQGMSNAEIAGYLFVTEQTVKTHVSSILTKLGLRDRVQIVVFAYESGTVSPRA